MKKKVVLKKLHLNKERIVMLTKSQAELVYGGGTATNIPKPKPRPDPGTLTPQPVPPITIQSRTEDCTIVEH